MVEAFVVVGLALVGTTISGIVWGIRLEGRINGHDIVLGEREKANIERHEEVVRRLDRIERKIDANGSGYASV